MVSLFFSLLLLLSSCGLWSPPLQFVPERLQVVCCPAGTVSGVELEVVLNDLEELWRLRDPAGLQLGPDREAVQGDLEGAGRDQLSLNRVT